MQQPASYIRGTGFFVPAREVPNSYFAGYLETSDEWIRDRTGIQTRFWVDPTQRLSDLAAPACEQALLSAGLTAADIDGILVATVSPDHVFPSTACVLQRRLGVTRGFGFDLNAVCSGFIYALATADSMIRSGLATNMLVVGADLFSRLVDHNDRSTVVLFGDGAGAAVVSKTDSTTGDRGILGAQLASDGRAGDILYCKLGSAAPASPEAFARGDHFTVMNGREVFKLAVRSLAEISESLLAKLNLRADEVDYIISHQANERILSAMAKHLHFPEEKVLKNVNRYGNTSAASVPILLAESAQHQTFKPGDLLMLSAFGGGVTWGALAVRW